MAFFFEVLINGLLVGIMYSLVALGFACWWIGRTPLTASFGRKVGAWVGGTIVVTITALVAFVVLPWALTPNQLPWEPFTRASLDQHIASGRTVLVDFTADW